MQTDVKQLKGTLPVANGGTGQSTQQAAIDALTNVAAATNEHVLTKDTGTGNAVFKAAVAGITELTGDVTAGPGAGSQAATIANDAVTNAKLANMAANTVKGNQTASSADPTDIAIGTNTVLGRVAGNVVAAALATDQIANDAVTYAKIQDVTATDRLLGRSTAGAGVVEEIVCTPFARDILDDADAAAVRTTIGAGTGSGDISSAANLTNPRLVIGDGIKNISTAVDLQLVYITDAAPDDTARLLAGPLIRIQLASSEKITLNINAADVLTATVGAVTINSRVQLGAALSPRVARLTTATTLDATHCVVLVDSGVAVIITLPASPSPTNGDFYIIKAIGAGTVTVDRNGNNINGAATNLTLIAGVATTLVWDPAAGTGWHAAAADGGTLVNADHELTPAASAGADDFDTTLAITNTPVGMVRVSVNGVHYTLGDGVKTKDFYFTGDGGVSARAISAIVATDELYFNAVVVGFDLDANDVIDILYET